jgi:outer membrane protein OmpA-like peptidoglycan-associated protein/tetratricopeptide (TPR) repeat protein
MKCSKSSVLLIGLIVISGAVWSQSVAVSRAERNLKHFDFDLAAENYKTAIIKSPNDISLKEKLARVYVLMEDHINAEALYAQIVKTPNSQAINRLYYGFELRANGKYDEAAKAFNDYAKVMSDDPRAKELSGSPDRMKTLATDNKIYEMSNLEDQNSPASEMGVAFYKDGILFSSNRGKDVAIIRQDAWTGKRFYDIYTSTRQGDKLSTPVKIKGRQPDRKYHEGPAIVSADGKEMFFTRTNYIRNHAKKASDKIIKLKIMHADWNDAKQRWVNIKELSIDNNNYSVGHPALSKDGKRLYFISDMPGGMGETDLYVSYRDMNNNWGPAINLGAGVNTKGRELFPFIAEDGTLYFSSDSRIGLGGLDIYSATFANGMWGNVQNMGAPLNTSADDFGYIVDAGNVNGYLISNRPGGKGNDDIYKFKKVAVTLCGTVVDAISKLPLPGSLVKLSDDKSVIATRATGDKGDFCFPVPPNKSYKLTASQNEYESNSTIAPASKVKQVLQIPLSKLGGIDLAVCVKQGDKGTLSGATVELTNKATGAKQTCTITADCKCRFNLEANTDYTICAYKQANNAKGSYDRPCKDITTKGKVAPASLYETLDMTYLEEDMVIKIENLYYDVNKWNIRPDAAVELDKLVALMHKFPQMEIELSSHTDCRAPMKYNDELSAKRAKACVEYLVAHGIVSKRMIAVGYGERHLVNNCACEGNVKSNCTEEQHQQNRRTEFKILKIK